MTIKWLNWRRITIIVVLLALWQIGVKLSGVSPVLVPPLDGEAKAVYERAIVQACAALPAFEQARPENQPDAPQSAAA